MDQQRRSSVELAVGVGHIEVERNSLSVRHPWLGALSRVSGDGRIDFAECSHAHHVALLVEQGRQAVARVRARRFRLCRSIHILLLPVFFSCAATRRCPKFESLRC